MGKGQEKTILVRKPLRSDATRTRILEAAREAFAKLGYDRATVRTIAEMANIHPSMVMRYYESKEGLFTASSQFDLGFPDLSAVAPHELGGFLVGMFLDRWERLGAAGDLPALLRLSVTHPEGREKAIAIFTRQVKPALARIIRSPGRARSTAFIATQLVGVAFLRYVLRLPDVVALTRQDLVEQVGQTIQRYIDGEDFPPASKKKLKGRA